VLLTRSVGPSVSGCRLEDIFISVPRRRQSVCHKPLANFGSRSLTSTRGSPCNIYTPCKSKLELSFPSTFYVHGKIGHTSEMVDHNQHTVKAIANMEVCLVVKTNYGPRSGRNMQWVKSRSHLWLNLCSLTYDATARSQKYFTS
jgi:hypothetical protein